MDTEFERGRKYGVRQAANFMIILQDQPTMAEEILHYCSERNWRAKFNREYIAKYNENPCIKGVKNARTKSRL